MNAAELVKVIRNKKIIGNNVRDVEVTSITNDSRKVTPGTCFVAIKGENFDGHKIIDQVIEAGANLIVVERFEKGWLQRYNSLTFVLVDSTDRTQAILANQFYGQPTKQLNLIAVTGTNGKTTTSQMINSWLEKLNHKTGVLGTLHYKVNHKYYDAINTTPNAIEIQALFKEMKDEGCTNAIIEASSHALQLGRLSYTDVDCAIFTNLTREHLDFHHTMEQYRFSKSLLFSQLGQSFENGRAKIAIVNLDDEASQTMIAATSAEVITYSKENSQATIYAKNIQQHPSSTSFTLVNEDKAYEVSLKMLGEYNVLNYLAAFACLKYYYNYSDQQIIEASMSFDGVPGRMQLVNQGQPYQVVVDFAHTPDAIENVLSELTSQKKGRLLTLIGHSGGNRDSGARPDIGHIVFKYSDYIIFTADNPRHENVEKICREIIGSHDEKPYEIIEDRIEAIGRLLDLAQEKDTLIFAGKGGEPYQIIGDVKHPFNESEIIINYLKK